MSNPTSNFGWQMPTPTDLVTDLPADFEVFGQAVDSDLADLNGGTTGQILSKTSNTDLDFTWINNDVGDITAVNVTSPVTGGGSSGAVTIGIQDGTTAQKGAVQLTDSTSSTSTTTAATPNAVKSVNDTALKPIPALSYITGRYYKSPNINALSTATTGTLNTTYYMPIYIRESRSFAKIGIQTSSSFSGTASIRLGIYNNSGNAPTTVLLDAGLIAPSAISTEYNITINQALTPGWYWLAFNTITSPTTNNFYVYTSASTIYQPFDLGAASAILPTAASYQQSVNVASGFATAASLSLSLSAAPAVYLVA